MNIFQYCNFATYFLISVRNSEVLLFQNFNWAYEGLKTDSAMNVTCERQVRFLELRITFMNQRDKLIGLSSLTVYYITPSSYNI